MSILSAILPGFREFRNPFTIGALWLACLLLVAYPSRDNLRDLSAVMTVRGIGSQFPASVQLGALASVAYLLGMLAANLQAAAETRLLYRVAQLARRRLEEFHWLPMLLSHPSPRAQGLATAAMEDRLHPIGSVLAHFAPRRIVLGEFDLAALRLSRDAADQYQQYDRLRAEAELRKGIAPPLFALTIILAVMLPLLPGIVLGIVGAVTSITFFFQGLGRGQEADEFMASAIYFGYTSTPILDSLESEAKVEFAGVRPSGEKQLGWLADFLASHRMLDDDYEFLSKLRHPSMSRDLLRGAVSQMSPETRDQLGWLKPEEGDESEVVAAEGGDA